MKTTVIGLFNNTKQVSASIHQLESMGLNAQQMSLITADNIDKDSFEITTNTKLPEAVGTGAAAGGALGLIVGGLAAVGSVATGGVGLLASGPIVAALTGGAFGAGGGGMLGAVLGTVMPDSEQQKIIDELEKNGALLCVECTEQEVSKVSHLLKTQNATKVETVNHAELEKIKGH
ncbi:general stress protein [Aliiglaciecola litoralis]|uniref:General stress protein 17M-like domain-containing protein n=1 Tax=Aliiglaciecola litoralis TaxID=582857 RepID=A0ABP3WMT9_9ALTE